MRPIPKHLQELLTDLRQLYPRFLLTDLLFRVISAITLLPALSWLYSRLISASGGSAVSNTDIVSFLLTPSGMLYLIVGSAFAIALLFAQMTGFLTIAYGAIQGHHLTWRQVHKILWQHATELITLGVTIVGSLLLTILPTIAVGGLLYLRNLTTYDINYYLKTTPPEFWWTIALVTPFVIASVISLGGLSVAALFSLPRVLFEDMSARQALRESRTLIFGARGQIIRNALLIGLVVAVCALLFDLLVSWSGTTALNIFSNQLVFLGIVVGLLLIANLLVSYLATFLTMALASIATARRYHQLTQQHNINPQLSIELANQKEPLARLYSVRLLASLSLLGLLIAGLIGWSVLSGVDYTDDVTITAHRGSSVAAPPNTLAAVEQAIVDGADYAEIDVQETKDGVLIVTHDKDFMLAAGEPLAVHEATWDEVQTLEVGSRFSQDFSGEGIPTLAQVLELAKDRIKVNIELKYYGQDQMLAERVVDEVRKMGMEEQVVIMSLHYAATQEVKALAPAIPVGFLASILTVGDLTDLDVDFLAVDSSLASIELVQRSHEKGKELFVWTINNESDMSMMMDRGVDSIITDYPERMVKVLAERAQMSQAERLLLSVSEWLAR